MVRKIAEWFYCTQSTFKSCSAQLCPYRNSRVFIQLCNIVLYYKVFYFLLCFTHIINYSCASQTMCTEENIILFIHTHTEFVVHMRRAPYNNSTNVAHKIFCMRAYSAAGGVDRRLYNGKEIESVAFLIYC